MTRIALALALCAVAGAAMAGEGPITGLPLIDSPSSTGTAIMTGIIDPDLAQAQMLCSAHVVGICASNPPFPCQWAPGWEVCAKINRSEPQLLLPSDKQDARDLDFVRGVAKEGGR